MSGYVYRVYDAHGLIYIGASRDVFARMAQHRPSSWWAPTVVKVRAQVYPDFAAARRAEHAAIMAEHPRWNRQEAWRYRRHVWDEREFTDYVVGWLNDTFHKLPGWPHLPVTLPCRVLERLDELKAEYRHRFGSEIDLREHYDFVENGRAVVSTEDAA